MKIIKLTTPWPHDYYKQTPYGTGEYSGYKFQINNGSYECDYWIVWGGLVNSETVYVAPERIIYITDEAHDQRKYNIDFLKQFYKIASVRTDLPVLDVAPIHEFVPWYFKRDYEEITSLQPPYKSKLISVVASDLTWLPGHKKRFAFVNKLIGHFKDKIDVFGWGFNAINDKYDALIDYKYSIAIENNCIPNYFTEKISECFLTYTMPVYYGCPNITEYYEQNSIQGIDIDDYKTAFINIERLIDEDPYQKHLASIINSREKFLSKYHMFPAIVKLIESINNDEKTQDKLKKKVSLIPEEQFHMPSFKAKIGVKEAASLLTKAILNKIS
jgi:hypothetical protein